MDLRLRQPAYSVKQWGVGGALLTKYISPIVDGTIVSNAPSPKPCRMREPKKLFALVAVAFQIAPPRSRIIDTRYTGRLPQTRPTAEPNRPATPAGQNCHPENVATTAYVVWNSFTRTALIGAMAGPSTAAIPEVSKSTKYQEVVVQILTDCGRETQNEQREIPFPQRPILPQLATAFLSA